MTDISIISENTFSREDFKKNNIKGPEGPDKTDAAAANRRVAKEMESLFAYQLLKVMRETANNISDEKKGIGHDTYSSLFDMEISRLLSERGMGLQDSIVKWLERMPVAVQAENDDNK
jgi:Rod binding domain-containing protein